MERRDVGEIGWPDAPDLGLLDHDDGIQAPPPAAPPRPPPGGGPSPRRRPPPSEEGIPRAVTAGVVVLIGAFAALNGLILSLGASAGHGAVVAVSVAFGLLFFAPLWLGARWLERLQQRDRRR